VKVPSVSISSISLVSFVFAPLAPRNFGFLGARRQALVIDFTLVFLIINLIFFEPTSARIDQEFV
jgi:hypothetical protein